MAAPVRHKCFITFHQADKEYVDRFVTRFDDVMIPRVLGVSDLDDFIDSDDSDYVMRRIREKYITDSTVTIMLTGTCTWARKYVDWEIASSLRNDPNNKRNGLLGIKLSYMPAGSTTVPERFHDNTQMGYAFFRSYPDTSEQLRGWIEKALDLRDTVTADNSRPLRKRNGTCP